MYLNRNCIRINLSVTEYSIFKWKQRVAVLYQLQWMESTAQCNGVHDILYKFTLARLDWFRHGMQSGLCPSREDHVFALSEMQLNIRRLSYACPNTKFVNIKLQMMVITNEWKVWYSIKSSANGDTVPSRPIMQLGTHSMHVISCRRWTRMTQVLTLVGPRTADKKSTGRWAIHPPMHIHFGFLNWDNVWTIWVGDDDHWCFSSVISHAHCVIEQHSDWP